MRCDAPLEPFIIDWSESHANDVVMELLITCSCQSYLLQTGNEWGFSQFPIVAGPEIIGRVTAVGTDITRHKLSGHKRGRKLVYHR